MHKQRNNGAPRIRYHIFYGDHAVHHSMCTISTCFSIAVCCVDACSFKDLNLHLLLHRCFNTTSVKGEQMVCLWNSVSTEVECLHVLVDQWEAKTMHCMYKQIHPPTGVEHCIYAHFFSWEEKNLIIAGVNQLHVYRLNDEPEVKFVSFLFLRYHQTHFFSINKIIFKVS